MKNNASSIVSSARRRGVGDVYTVLLLVALVALITAAVIVGRRNSQMTNDSNPLKVMTR